MTISISDVSVETVKGESKPMSDYKGDVLLIVNVASKCGNTPQYAQLEALNQKYAAQGLRVLGFPCNDFGDQEPGTLKEIQQFCSMKYDVSFPIFNKVHARGDDKSPLYARLTQADVAGDAQTGDVTWNFEKFVVAKDGTVVARFKPKTKPDSAEVVEAIERELTK